MEYNYWDDEEEMEDAGGDGVEWGGELEELESDTSEKMVDGTEGVAEAGSTPGVISDVDVLASEVLSNKRLLAIFLALGVRPRQGGELASLKICSVNCDSLSGDKLVCRKIASSTAYRLLKRLVEAGLVSVHGGLDYRKRYYKLTGLGKKVLVEVKNAIRSILRNELEPSKKLDIEAPRGYRGLDEQSFNEVVARRIGAEPTLVIELMEGVVKRGRLGKQLVLIRYGE